LYEAAKDSAHAIYPVDPEVYNKAKEPVIKQILSAVGKTVWKVRIDNGR